MKKLFSNKIFILVLFSALAFIALQINLTHIAGSKVGFTMFDSFGPLAGATLGTLPGTITLLVLQIVNAIIHKQSLVSVPLLIHLVPVLLASWYFGKKNIANLIIPIVAIAVFNLNPVGRSVWYYSFYWLIPIVAYFWQERSLLARSLGATFTAHAVGGALWVWLVPLPKAVWVALIPVVAVERLLLTAGLIISYLAIKRLISALSLTNNHAPIPAHQNQGVPSSQG